MTPEELSRKLHEAQDIIAPLFGIEKQITFEAGKEFAGSQFQGEEEAEYISEDEELERDFNYELLKAAFGERVQIVAYIDGRFLIDEDMLDNDLPKSALDIGAFVSFHLYNQANPSLEEERLLAIDDHLAKEDCHPKEYELACNLSKAHTLLLKIIEHCGGLAYAEKMRESAVSDEHSFSVAQQLYAKRGSAVIKELSPLSFNDARAYIRDVTGIDELDPTNPKHI